jgi:hypothetical protein
MVPGVKHGYVISLRTGVYCVNSFYPHLVHFVTEFQLPPRILVTILGNR